jgi:hypothetical protein
LGEFDTPDRYEGEETEVVQIRGGRAAGGPVPAYLVLQRVFFAACIVLGPSAFLLYAVFDPAGSSRSGGAVIAANAAASAGTNQLHLAFGVVASLLLPFGYLGMALLAMRRRPWLGTVCILLSLPSWTPLSALIALDALSYDVARMGGAQLVALWNRFNTDGVMSAFLITYALLHLVSTVLLGIALGWSGLIPRWAGWALILSSVLTIIAFPAHLTVLLYVVSALLVIGSVPAALATLKGAGEEA